MLQQALLVPPLFLFFHSFDIWCSTRNYLKILSFHMCARPSTIISKFLAFICVLVPPLLFSISLISLDMMSVSKSRVRLSLEYILTLKKAWVCVRVRVNANSQSLFSFRLDMYYRNRIYFLSLTTCVCFNSYSRSFSLDMLVYVCIHMCAPTPSLLPIVMYCFTSSSSSVSPFPLTLLPLL